MQVLLHKNLICLDLPMIPTIYHRVINYTHLIDSDKTSRFTFYE